MRSHSNSFTDYCVEMTKEFKTFTRATLDDALTLVRERFPAHAQEIARQALENPSLSDGMGSGAIGYRDGRPVALQLGMPRKVYLGQDQILGLVGGMTCKALKGCPLSLLLETIDRSCFTDDENTIYFGNTCCNATADMDSAGGSMPGPDSCSRYRYAMIRKFDFLRYVVRRKALKLSIPNWNPALPKGREWSCKIAGLEIRREMRLDQNALELFWSAYLKKNSGIVLSRAFDDLQWLFGDRIASSRCVFLGCRREGALQGYIILKTSTDAGRRWGIADMIATENDPKVIDTMLQAAKRFLKQCTKAFLFETMGFPVCIQPILAKNLPCSRAAACNFFAYTYANDALKRHCDAILNSPKSWFFGPYDGDMCMA